MCVRAPEEPHRVPIDTQPLSHPNTIQKGTVDFLRGKQDEISLERVIRMVRCFFFVVVSEYIEVDFCS